LKLIKKEEKTGPNKPAASNAGGFRRQTFIKPKNDIGKENINQVNPALAAAGRPLAQIIKHSKHDKNCVISWLKLPHIRKENLYMNL